MSGDKQRFAEALPRLRAAIEEFQASLEAADGDQVVQFSVQVFPLLVKT